MPLEKLAFFLAEIEPLKAEESVRRVNEIRVANAGPKEQGARDTLKSWEDKADRKDRIIWSEVPKMTEAEYNAMVAIMGMRRV